MRTFSPEARRPAWSFFDLCAFPIVSPSNFNSLDTGRHDANSTA
jgi:hypothetical protein